MGWIHVQGASAAGNATTDPTLTLGSPSAVGNLLIAGVANYNQPITNVNDNRNGNWTKLLQVQIGTLDVEVWYLLNTYSASALTVTDFQSNYGAFTVDEFSFVGTLNTDGTNSAGGTNASPACGNVTVSAYDLVYGVVGVGNPEGSYTAGSGYTLTDTVAYSSGVNLGVAAEYLLNSQVSPATPGFSLGSSASWTMIGASFQTPTPPSNIAPALLLIM